MRHGCDRHPIGSVVPDAFFRESSACHGIKFRLGHLPRASWTEGLWICFRACPFLRSWRALLVRRFILWLDEAAAFLGGSMIRDPKAFRSSTGDIFTPCQHKGTPSRRLEVIGS